MATQRAGGWGWATPDGWCETHPYLSTLPTYLPGRANTKHHPANWLIPCQTCGNSTKYIASGFVTWSTPSYPFFFLSTKSGVWESATVPRIACSSRYPRSYSSLPRSEFQEVWPVVPLPLAILFTSWRRDKDIDDELTFGLARNWIAVSSWHILFNSVYAEHRFLLLIPYVSLKLRYICIHFPRR